MEAEGRALSIIPSALFWGPVCAETSSPASEELCEKPFDLPENHGRHE